jgi:hypothetical protein
MRIKENKWLDGRQLDKWPIEEHVGWSVETAGWVDLDIEDRTPMFNNGPTRRLPPHFPMILKEVKGEYAYTYNHNEGVIRVPYTILRPISR